MIWKAFATDFDGTIASDGVVDEPTLAALKSLRPAGIRCLLVTGRELPELKGMDLPLDIFDLIVAENGALLYDPAKDASSLIAPPASAELAVTLEQRGVPISIGGSIIATVEPHETTVLEVIHELGLEQQVIFNKGAVMILPSGINKATGLKVALDTWGILPSETVGVGDAENDHAFLETCGYPVAVANAVPALKEKVVWTTTHSAGAGVTELIEALLAGRLAYKE
jgi:hydroxymethylpyrimidine pyrophosphatase-like HAD family hydrolase